MAITYFGKADVPADNNATGNIGPTVTITPPASMLADDYVLVLIVYKSTAVNLVFNITTDGGQAWTQDTQVNGATGMVSQIQRCKFNGTWAANPVWTMSNGGTSPMQGSMWVFRGVDTASPIDVASAGAQFAAPTTPFDVTRTGITTNTADAMAVAMWCSNDDNTWVMQTAGWTNPGALGQVRNLGGTDTSVSAAYQAFAGAGATGNVTNRQTVNGGDSGNTHIMALKAAVATTKAPPVFQRRKSAIYTRRIAA